MLICPAKGDSRTTIDNERVYAVNVRLFVDRTARKHQDAERILRKLCDSVLDDFDKDFTMTGITLPTGYTMMYVEAAPAEWGYADREEKYREKDFEEYYKLS